MKLLKYLLITCTTVIMITACQKELSFDVDGNARGTLKSDASGDCLPSTVNGIYKADSVLNNTNFIDVQVDISNPGTYSISSDTINGYSFSGTGTLGLNGLNTVRLYAAGKPILAGTNSFTISFDNSTCVVDVTVISASTGAAVFTLEGAPGTCSGAIVNGTYTAGTSLAIDNTVTITVNVSVPGTYLLNTVAGNGMLFSSTGVFPTAGIQSVTLNGTGMPLNDGTINLTAINGTSTCTFSITVLPSGGPTPAVFTLTGDPGTCSGAIANGTYTAGVGMTGSNSINLNVNVITTGTYSVISTDTNNGLSFSIASGTFVTTGPQVVTLIPAGIPFTAGTFNYTATAGTSVCTFSVTVLAATNQDYVPETSFSNWTDKLVGGNPGDTSYVQVSPNDIIVGGTSYRIFEVKENGIAVDSFLHRKNGGLYFQLFDNAYGFDNPFNAAGLLLDSSQAVNSTWAITLGSNTISNVPATGKINCKIIEKGATATIAGNSYTDIIKVTYTYIYNAGAGDTSYALEEIWYAKGKGVVYYKYNDQPVTTTEVYETTRLQVF